MFVGDVVDELSVEQQVRDLVFPLYGVYFLLVDQLPVSPLLLIDFHLLLFGAISLVVLSHFKDASSVPDILLKLALVVVLSARAALRTVSTIGHESTFAIAHVVSPVT